MTDSGAESTSFYVEANDTVIKFEDTEDKLDIAFREEEKVPEKKVPNNQKNKKILQPIVIRNREERRENYNRIRGIQEEKEKQKELEKLEKEPKKMSNQEELKSTLNNLLGSDEILSSLNDNDGIKNKQNKSVINL